MKIRNGENSELNQIQSVDSEQHMNNAALVYNESDSSEDQLHGYLTNRILLILIVSAVLLVYGPTFVWLVKRWSLGVWYHPHGFIVLPVSGYLALKALQGLPNKIRQASPYGFFFLVPALFLHIMDTALQSYLLSSISLVFAIVGLSLLLLGSERTRILWFPLIFLFFMIPIPLVMVEGLRILLRIVTSIFSHQLLELVGIPIYREGTTLFITRGQIQVADACSGFSTLMAMMLTGSLYAYICTSLWWERTLIMVISIPLAIMANIARTVFLTLLVLRFDFQILNTQAHPASGVLAFILAFSMLALVHWSIIKVMRTSS